jgi:hypothetical protein
VKAWKNCRYSHTTPSGQWKPTEFHTTPSSGHWNLAEVNITPFSGQSELAEVHTTPSSGQWKPEEMQKILVLRVCRADETVYKMKSMCPHRHVFDSRTM